MRRTERDELIAGLLDGPWVTLRSGLVLQLPPHTGHPAGPGSKCSSAGPSSAHRADSLLHLSSAERITLPSHTAQGPKLKQDPPQAQLLFNMIAQCPKVFS